MYEFRYSNFCAKFWLLPLNVSITLVRKFSIDSIPKRITKSSPTPIVNAYDSVRLAASRLKRPAGVA